MDLGTTTRHIIDNVEQVIVGKHETVQRVLVALLCRGHVLLDDVPGVGKTVLAKALARSLGCTYSRVQCTPDILPSDITGVSIYNQQSGEFEYRPGPIVAQIVLTDEINRATPKTQSALLEAMEERQITVDGRTILLPRPFMIIATQNPIEFEGTFQLPEGQLDRFLVRLQLGYPSPEAEMQILDSQRESHPLDQIGQVVSADDILAAQRETQAIYVDDLVKRYVVDIVGATRLHPDIYLGASPRGSLALFRTAQAHAALDGRDYVIPDDVKDMARDALAHRLIVHPSARVRGIAAEDLVREILSGVPVPGARVKR